MYSKRLPKIGPIALAELLAYDRFGPSLGQVTNLAVPGPSQLNNQRSHIPMTGLVVGKLVEWID